ncbi:MAG: branched-chain amino acid transport system substrate-binding protein [Acidimicrobiaceae bacterium]|jgi:ABC-type branched-subunit amino acid transport system substrate-binding protein
MTRTRRRHLRVAAVLIGLIVLAAACGSDNKPAASSSASKAPASKKGALAGTKGTTPLVDLPADFKAKLDAQGLNNANTYNYGAESYDATIIIALAADVAGSDGIDMAKAINGVTRGGTKCTTYKQCSDLVKAGTKDIDYDGQSGPGEFSGNGEPTVASYGIQVFDANNRIDDSKTTYKTAKAPASADVPEVPVEGTRAGDGTLKIGTLLPETGSLAFLGPPMRSGVRLAVKEINEAGGAVGKDVVVTEGDSSDAQNPTVATQTVDRELGEGVDAIIGAASSAVTLNVIDKVTSAGVAMFSPANTSKKLSSYPDKGLYFRDAPSDILQGQVLGELLASDGVTTAGLLVLNDAYGTGLAEDFTKAFEASGGKVTKSVIYDPKAQTFDNEVDQVKGSNPEAVILISFDEASRLLATMVEKGLGPSDVKVYGVDGWMGNTAGQNFDAGK